MTGLSEIIPAAAPPLGNTARSLIAVAAGMISASALYLFLNHKPKFHEGDSDMSLATRRDLMKESMDIRQEGKSRFAGSSFSAKSLTRFLRKPKKSRGQVTELKDLQDTRQADRHPDAPARQPIFASSDLGLPLTEKIQRGDQLVDEPVTAEPEEGAAQPTATPQPPATEEEQQSQFEERPSQYRAETVPQPEKAVTSRADLSALSLAELADRLEAGLARLEKLQRREPAAMPTESAATVPDAENVVSSPEAAEAPAPVTIPPLRSVEPVEPAETDSGDRRQADMDAALKAALGTLERMTVRR
jgi:hypothetical protein